MTVLALALGVIQGLGEFLPISSSAHLVLTRHGCLAGMIPAWYSTWRCIWGHFAVVAFFWRDWVELLMKQLLNAGAHKRRHCSGIC